MACLIHKNTAKVPAILPEFHDFWKFWCCSVDKGKEVWRGNSRLHTVWLLSRDTVFSQGFGRCGNCHAPGCEGGEGCLGCKIVHDDCGYSCCISLCQSVPLLSDWQCAVIAIPGWASHKWTWIVTVRECVCEHGLEDSAWIIMQCMSRPVVDNMSPVNIWLRWNGGWLVKYELQAAWRK